MPTTIMTPCRFPVATSKLQLILFVDSTLESCTIAVRKPPVTWFFFFFFMFGGLSLQHYEQAGL